jgi:hypothetical protein
MQHTLLDTEQVLTLGLDRCIAAPMHDEIRIRADQSRGIDPKRERLVRRVIARRTNPCIRFLVIPSVLTHYRLLPL